MKLVVEQRMNIMAACHMMDTWLVIYNVQFNVLIPKQLSIIPDSIPVPSMPTIHFARQSKDLTPWSELEQGDPVTSPLCCSKTGYNSRSESISIAVRLKAKRRALNCCQNVDSGTWKKKRLLTNYKQEWRAVRPSIGSKGKLRQQFNLHFSHTGCFFYRRTSTVDGAALPFDIQQLCRPLLGKKPGLKKLSTLRWFQKQTLSK
jgi:hypothetical protein